MTVRTALRREWDALSYWSRWLLLEMFGPATQDSESDPIQQLKRRYGRPTTW